MTWQEELEEIRLAHGGILRPSDVVEYARNPETALHPKFEWDDFKASEAYRLWQARQIIRVVVYVPPSEEGITRASVQLYHPLPPPVIEEDVEEGTPVIRERGYDTICNIMSDTERRKQLLDQAYTEMRIFRKKYQDLKELAPLFDAIDTALAVNV